MLNKEPSEICLDVQHLVKSYSGHRAVNDLSFHINQGEVVGLLGPNGAGKTTAFYMTIGLARPDAGKVYFQGHDVTFLPIHKRAQMGMGYLAQEPSVFRALTVEENILCILENQPLNKAERLRRLDELLNELHLTTLAKKKAATLSGGERRRLEITRALVTNPSLLLLDEPFANIDPLSVNELKHLISILADKKISVLITDHNARELFSIVHRSYLIYDGKAVLSGTSEELINDEFAQHNYFGRDFKL